jgi:redox-sensing transcriptional repressor
MTMSTQRSDVPSPSVRRLSLYLRQLEMLQASRVTTVSSNRLGQSLSLTDAQVRKDLAYFGQFGRPGVGYEVAPLIDRLRRILGTDRVWNTILVGVGNLGRAISAYQGFAEKGFNLIGAFDEDPRKIGKKIGAVTIAPSSELPHIVTRDNVQMAILAVPAEVAQAVADRLVEAGIRGILNFAPVQLQVPPEVTVRSLDVAAELEQLTFAMTLKG